MSYTLKLTPTAIEDIEFHKRSGDKATLKKLSVLFDELCKQQLTMHRKWQIGVHRF